MARVPGAENVLCDLVTRPFVDLFDGHDGEDVVVRIPQGDLLVETQPIEVIDRKGDRDGKQGAVAESHLRNDAFKIGARHKAVERRETSIREQLQIADGALAKLHGRQCYRLRKKLFS